MPWLRGRRTAVAALLAVVLHAAASCAPTGLLGAEGRPGPPGAPGGPPPVAALVAGATTGSAFAIDAARVVTNAHVVAGVEPGGEVLLVRGGAAARAVLLARSPRFDVAVLRQPPGFLPALEPAARPVAAGTRVVAFGGAGAGAGGAAAPRGAAAPGVVAEPDLALGPFGAGFVARAPGAARGFSGGPVLDGDGRLVGMLAGVGRAGRSAFEPPGAPPAGGGAGTEAFAIHAAAVVAEVERLVPRRGEGP